MIAVLLCTAGEVKHKHFTPGLNRQYGIELTEQITDWLRSVEKTRAYGQRYYEAIEMIPFILDSCEKYDVDPLRVGVLAREENSWYQRGWGEKGEVGPLQVMPKWFKQFNLQTLEGQIDAGVWWIGEGMKKCKGKGAHAFNWYFFGKCGKVPAPDARRRERLYQKAVKKYRRERTR
jgi:hypothetical protein